MGKYYSKTDAINQFLEVAEGRDPKSVIEALLRDMTPDDIIDFIERYWGIDFEEDEDDQDEDDEDEEEDDGNGQYECQECGSTYHPTSECPNVSPPDEEVVYPTGDTD